MNRVVIAFVAGAVLVGAAGFGTLIYPQMRARQEVDKAIAEMAKDLQVSYRTVDYSMFTGTLTLGGVEFTAHDGGDTALGRIASLSLRGVSRNGIGELHGSGLSLEDGGHGARVDAERIDGEGLNSAEGLQASLSGSSANLDIKRLALSGVKVDAGGDKVHLREVVLADYVQAGTVPRSLSLGIHGLLVDSSTLPDHDARQALAALGYQSLALNFDLAYEHAVEARRLVIKQASFGGDGAGRISLTASFGGMPDLTAADPALALAAAQAATLEQLELRYDDASLAGRVFKLASAQSGMEEAQWREWLVAKLNEDLGDDAATPLNRDVVDSAATFLAAPKSLTLRMQPAQPLPLAQVLVGAGDPAAILQATGLNIFANR